MTCPEGWEELSSFTRIPDAKAFEVEEIGARRTLNAVKKGIPDRAVTPKGRDRVQNDKNSACGEYAFSLMTQLPWYGGDDSLRYKKPDVGEHYQVRTVTKHYFCLVVRPYDEDRYDYILIQRHDKLAYEFLGWMNGAEAKSKKERLENYYDGRPGYFVKQKELHKDLYLR